MTAALPASEISDGSGATDTFAEVENIQGSVYGDTLDFSNSVSDLSFTINADGSVTVTNGVNDIIRAAKKHILQEN